MSRERVLQLLQQKEGLRLEFKRAEYALPNNLFESICAMLNRDGGDILLGVADDGSLIGVDSESLAQLMIDISNLSNNSKKLDPPFILFPIHHIIKGKNIIHIQVPASSELHHSAGIVFDRSSDGDFKALQPHQIASLHNYKRNFYTESRIYPGLSFNDFEPSLFPKVRQLMRSNYTNHPWLALNDHQMLEKAGLKRKDYATGEEGYTLAAALLFGKDQVIQQILPHYKIDGLVRIKNTMRYDDRVYIQTNLIDAYELLMNFVEKHLPDKFHLHGAQRISIRSQIFREVIANLIIHREYTNGHPCSFVIQNDKVVCENANNPHGEGPIDPNHFAPYPKNPALAKFFIQLGRVDELGSGVLNVYRLVKEYGGKGNPLFVEGAVFRMEIPIPMVQSEGLNLENRELNQQNGELNSENRELNQQNEELNSENRELNQQNGELNEGLKSILNLIASNPGIKAKEISAFFLKQRPIKTIYRQINDLIILGKIKRKGSKKTGGYFVDKTE